MQLNEIYFAGFVGRDAEIHNSKSGTKIVSFSLCHSVKGKDGRPDVSTWIRVKVFGAWGETAAEIKKGDNVFVKGNLNVSEYTGKDGTKKTMMEVLAYSLSILKVDKKSERQEVAPFPPKNDNFDLEDIPF